jgi:drug/metabolite transporter (DMT)-like permease
MSPNSTSQASLSPPALRIDVRKGMLWMLLSLVSFSSNALLIKHCSSDRHIDPWLTMACRFAVGLTVTGILFGHTGALRIHRIFLSRLLASRGVMGALGTAAYYFSIGPLGAGKATLIGNTWTAWSAILAAAVLHERLGLVKSLGIAVAIFGLLLLTGISPESLMQDGKWELLSLCGAVLSAFAIVVIRQLTGTETSATIFASQCVYGLLLALPFAAPHFARLSLADYLVVLTAGLCASIGQLAMTEGFRFLTVASGGAYQMAVPLLISVGGVFFFNEHFTWSQAIGGSLIIFGSFQTVVGFKRRVSPTSDAA